MTDTTLWLTNGASIILVVLNTLFWGYAINQVGTIHYDLSFIWKLGTNPWFILAISTSLVSTFVTYYARSTLGLAKGSLFYSLGTVALILTSYAAFHETFTLRQGIGVVAIMVGVVLVS